MYFTNKILNVSVKILIKTNALLPIKNISYFLNPILNRYPKEPYNMSTTLFSKTKKNRF